MHILIIEDDEAIRLTLQDMLEFNGHRVTAAGDGRSALNAARQQPDLILCDVGLPDMDGFEVLQQLHARPECQTIPFIFLTARADRDDQRRGMALGADDYITKPFTEREILEAIAARVKRQAPLKERLQELLTEKDREINAPWSHELMTPLNGVLGGLELIEAEADTIKPEELRELLQLIRAGAERQQELARKLVLYFELEQLKRAGRRLDDTTCESQTVVPAAVEAVTGHLSPQPKVFVEVAPATLRLNGARLQAALRELIDNACRFSPAGQPIDVIGTVHRPGVYHLTVTDHGPGLPVQDEATTHPFVQFERQRTEQQGLGLGLAIVRSVVELAAGRLDLHPGPDNVGLRAMLEIPCE